MNIIPIVFCFDDNLKLPAAICLSSLLTHKAADTFYDIFIIHDKESTFNKDGYFDTLNKKFTNFKINFRLIGNEFNNAFEIRGITKAAYYRLLIPRLVPEYSKIMYHDVDIIFRDDLAKIYLETDIEDYYIAGVISPGSLDKKIYESRMKMGFDPYKYILSGDLIFNSKLIIQDGLIEKFIEEAKKKYIHQDQDIINIVCNGKIKILPPKFCGTIEAFRLHVTKEKQAIYSTSELDEVFENGIIHYNGPKPWKNFCPNFDIWWEYYRRSIFFNEKFYFDFFQKKMNEFDRLPLMKRIKILVRYFVFGIQKD